MRTTLLIAALMLLQFTALRAEDLPSGRLGHPLGTYLTIEGCRVEGPKTGERTLLVDTVNGKKLDPAIPVGVENIEPLPKDARCVLRGYETGSMVGMPPAVIEAAKEEGRTVNVPQAGWQFRRYFIVISVVQPKDLKKK
jgi:hypothetical protein